MARSERGQVLVLFAVLVPTFVAMMVFVLNMGKAYFDHAGNQQTAESVRRTVKAILGNSAVAISEEDLPLDVKKYSPTEDQIALKKLESAIDFLKDKTDADIKQKFMIDNGNIYYRVDVTEADSSIFKIVGDVETASNPADLIAQLLNATDSEKNTIINKLVNPSTPEQKSAHMEALSAFLSNPVDSTDISSAKNIEKNMSAILLALLSINTAFNDKEKGALFEVFLSRKLTGDKLQSPNAINLKSIAIGNAPNIAAREAADILYKYLSVEPSVTALARKSVDSSIVITYEDSNATKLYHKITVKDAASGSNTVTHNESDTQFTV